MKKIVLLALCFATCLFAYNSCFYDNEEDLYPTPKDACDTINTEYSIVISHIMLRECNTCHLSASPSGGVITDNHSDLLTIVNNGQLWGSINHLSGFSPMPKGSNKLKECEIRQIQKWMEQGAPNN